jgi:hypothetical protein
MKKIDLTGIENLCELEDYLQGLIPDAEAYRGISEDDRDFLFEEVKEKFGVGGLNILQGWELGIEPSAVEFD